jgi:hypothetical protein
MEVGECGVLTALMFLCKRIRSGKNAQNSDPTGDATDDRMIIFALSWPQKSMRTYARFCSCSCISPIQGILSSESRAVTKCPELPTRPTVNVTCSCASLGRELGCDCCGRSNGAGDPHDYSRCADQPTEATLRLPYDDVKYSGSSLPHGPARHTPGWVARLQVVERVVLLASSREVEVKKDKVLRVRPLVQPHIDLDAYVATVMQTGQIDY